MGRALHKLTAIGAQKVAKKGLHADGGGLYLKVGPTGGKSWVFRYLGRYAGLGPFPDVNLAAAREAARVCREQLARGVDPIEARTAERKQMRPARAVTFGQAAMEYVAAHEPAWRSPKTSARWRSAIRLHIEPVLGGTEVKAVDVEGVLAVLKPIWAGKPETAAKTREIMERVLDWSRVRGLRDGTNPALWRGNLQHLLPKRDRLASEKHPAMHWREAPAFFQRLGGNPSERCLAFLMLTGARSGEARGATWREIEDNIWRVPAKRMKGGSEHVVPLPGEAMRLLNELPQCSDFLFPGQRSGRPLTDMGLATVLKRHDRDDVTVHGFRSTFRTWIADATSFPRELGELALAHTVGNAIERAYQRSDLLEKRRQLMETWADFCTRA